jgi:hypothetical protein
MMVKRDECRNEAKTNDDGRDETKRNDEERTIKGRNDDGRAIEGIAVACQTAVSYDTELDANIFVLDESLEWLLMMSHWNGCW